MDEERVKAVFRALAEQNVEYAVFGAVALSGQWAARSGTPRSYPAPDDHLQRTRDGLVLHGKGTRRAIAMRTRK